MPRLEIIHGNTSNPSATRELLEVLNGLNPKGTLYVGYPVLALADDRVNVEALLVTERFGLVAFLTETLPAEPIGTAPWKEIQQRQDHNRTRGVSLDVGGIAEEVVGERGEELWDIGHRKGGEVVVVPVQRPQEVAPTACGAQRPSPERAEGHRGAQQPSPPPRPATPPRL